MDSEKLNEQWRRIYAQVSSYPDVDESQVSAFFSRLEAQAMSNSFLMLTANNDFIKTWVEQNYVPVIQRALLDLTGVSFAVAVAVDPGQEARKAAEPITPAPAQTAAPTPFPTPSPAVAAPPAPVAAPIMTAPTTPEQAGSEAEAAVVENGAGEADVPTSALTFSNFVIGDSNRYAYSMALEVADKPGQRGFNPLFIYGKSGLGKTHLMRAIQNNIRETQPYRRTVFVDAAELLNQYAEASATHDREKSSFKNFKSFYEEADVLFIDDVQGLQGKDRTLDIVFQLFNTLTNQGHQVVLSADRAPKALGIDDRYQSRFAGGALVDIQPPDVETKLGIVKSVLQEIQAHEGLGHLTPSDDIQMCIAEMSGSNIRELKAAVTTVVSRMNFLDRDDITTTEVRSLLENHFSGGMARNLVVEDIQHVVEEFYKISHEDLVGRARNRPLVYPRQIAMYLCRQILGIPFSDIAAKFNRDHSTAMHATSVIEGKLQTEWSTQCEIEALQRTIREL